ncbi:MAG: hypothetical protein HFI56_13360 [Lachnospiraceae bacterium]|nr:hypothetical protein [Lachnospiraceae bacterium]
MMKKLLIPKGSFGYLENRKKVTALRTLLFFLISGSFYAAGILLTKTNKNLLTIVAILLCLPACKSTVNMILFLRAKGCSGALHKKVSAFGDDTMTVFYDLYFTSYQKNYPISHMVLKGSMLCGITENPSCSCSEAEKHLSQMFLQEGIKNVTVNIFSQEDKYIDRLGRLSDMQVEEHKERDGIINLLHTISI